MSSEQKGNEYIAEAEKKIKSSEGFFGSLFGGQSKLEEAADYYVSAGNSFKMAKKWTAAGNAFSEAAKLHLHRLQSKHNAATNYVEAANCHKKGDAQLSIESFQQAIELFTEMGRFTMAAKHHVSIAELYETGLLDVEKAMENYEQAADYYKGEDSSSSANKCLLKVAHFSAQQENYQKAINIYEEVAANSLESPLLKYSAKDYFFRSLLCQMCVDVLEAQRALERYNQMYPAFEDSREYKLIQKLGEATEAGDVEMFTDAVREYDSISRLDQWYTTILLRIKKTIAEEPALT